MKLKLILVFAVLNCVAARMIPNKDVKIVIVGAGAAGVAAGTRLLERGYTNLVIYEAEPEYWGGRVRSVKFASNVVDLGAQWCHGQGENPVYKMGKPFDLFDVTAEPDEFLFTKPDGENIPKRSGNRLMWILEEIIEDNAGDLAKYKGSFGDFVTEKYYEILKSPIYLSIDNETRAQVLEYFHRYMNADISSDTWFDVSAKGDLEYWEYPGEVNNNWKDKGYATVFKLLTKSYPEPNKESIDIEVKIVLNATVKNIEYKNKIDQVQLVLEDSSIVEADHVIVTSSLGVLKERYESLFTPALPPYKVRAIKGLSLGTVDKLFLEFKTPFWSKSFDGLKIIWTDDELVEIRKRKDSWIEGIISFDLIDYQPNILMGWVWADFARKMETIDEKQVQESCLFILRKFLPKINIPNPVAFKRTQWYTNKNFRGSYSYRSMLTEELKTSSSELARPLLGKYNTPVIHFAGEATSKHYYSTVHGAIESGWREADRIMRLN